MKITKKFMDENNGHNKRLVNYINHLCSAQNCVGMVTIILRAICERDGDECRERFGFVPFYEEDIIRERWSILTDICDDMDLVTIIHFCGYAV